MPRVKRGTNANKKRSKVLKATKGFRWGRKSKERLAKDALLHSQSRAFKGRKEKKRVFRSLWNIQINAAVREHDLTYGKFINALKKKNIIIDRKILANLAKSEPEAFKKILEEAKK